MNALTREVGLKAGPVLLERLVKHYFDRLKEVNKGTPLRQDDILYDEAFTIVKAFLHASSFHTVEELQGFSNTRTPSPPWTSVVRVIVPLVSCDEAAIYLIKALGGEDMARRIVGGVKWWQVRGVKGVDAQWITAKKDWREAKRRYKMQQRQKQQARTADKTVDGEGDTDTYDKNMDEMRCILYLHGGGYYFGSVDQERYSIERLARKISGRVFAINYRLAPQYPFPCALQDALAAYLFLIRPPPGVAHRPVQPKHMIISGDSAGGGLSLALLQVIRDTGLPMPAGGVLISPWCDLTHSFPSIHTNTDTDVLPSSGLSFHKPSILWPPPPPEVSTHVHASLRHRIRQVLKLDDHGRVNPVDRVDTMLSEPQPSGLPVDIGATTPVPPIGSVYSQKVTLLAKSGEQLEIDDQVQLYTQNNLLAHPLVSPSLSYLGGLPPLLFIASDKEVLRDEIIYAAHKAANPPKFHIKDHLRSIYPPLEGIEERHSQPTSVHLQVYDDAAHILPILFSFTTPAKYCFRAMATFTRFVTGMDVSPSMPANGSLLPLNALSLSPKASPEVTNDHDPNAASGASSSSSSSAPQDAFVDKPIPNGENTSMPINKPHRKSLRRAFTAKITQAGSAIRRRASSVGNVRRFGEYEPPEPVPALPQRPPPKKESSATSSDVGGRRFGNSASDSVPSECRMAGEAVVYRDLHDGFSWDSMIRERVSTKGIIRPLEPESELDAFQINSDCIGVLSELAVRRYLNGRVIFDRKFSHTSKSIEKARQRNLDRAKSDTIKRMTVLQNTLAQNEGATTEEKDAIKQDLLSSPDWGWAWALDDDEKPPPSSIASRRDTEEARRLAEIADQAILGEDHTLSGNNLWSVVMGFLTKAPEKHRHSSRPHPETSQTDKKPSTLSQTVTSEPNLSGTSDSNTE